MEKVLFAPEDMHHNVEMQNISLEQAMGRCPFLGKMAMEDVELLLSFMDDSEQGEVALEDSLPNTEPLSSDEAGMAVLESIVPNVDSKSSKEVDELSLSTVEYYSEVAMTDQKDAEGPYLANVVIGEALAVDFSTSVDVNMVEVARDNFVINNESPGTIEADSSILSDDLAIGQGSNEASAELAPAFMKNNLGAEFHVAASKFNISQNESLKDIVATEDSLLPEYLASVDPDYVVSGIDIELLDISEGIDDLEGLVNFNTTSDDIDYDMTEYGPEETDVDTLVSEYVAPEIVGLIEAPSSDLIDSVAKVFIEMPLIETSKLIDDDTTVLEMILEQQEHMVNEFTNRDLGSIRSAMYDIDIMAVNLLQSVGELEEGVINFAGRESEIDDISMAMADVLDDLGLQYTSNELSYYVKWTILQNHRRLYLRQVTMFEAESLSSDLMTLDKGTHETKLRDMGIGVIQTKLFDAVSDFGSLMARLALRSLGVDHSDYSIPLR